MTQFTVTLVLTPTPFFESHFVKESFRYLKKRRLASPVLHTESVLTYEINAKISSANGNYLAVYFTSFGLTN